MQSIQTRISYFSTPLFLTVIICLNVPALAATRTISPELEADGVLIDTNLDDTYDAVSQGGSDGFELSVGNRFGKAQATVVEFALPTNVKDVKSATFSLVPNGKHGTYPNEHPERAPDATLYVYWGKTAEGKITEADLSAASKPNAQESRVDAGPFIEQGTPLSAGGRFPKDVTKQVQQAVTDGAAWIGFCIVTDNLPDHTACWRWRSSEFADRHGKQYAPQLEIATAN